MSTRHLLTPWVNPTIRRLLTSDLALHLVLAPLIFLLAVSFNEASADMNMNKVPRHSASYGSGQQTVTNGAEPGFGYTPSFSDTVSERGFFEQWFSTSDPTPSRRPPLIRPSHAPDATLLDIFIDLLCSSILVHIALSPGYVLIVFILAKLFSLLFGLCRLLGRVFSVFRPSYWRSGESAPTEELSVPLKRGSPVRKARNFQKSVKRSIKKNKRALVCILNKLDKCVKFSSAHFNELENQHSALRDQIETSIVATTENLTIIHDDMESQYQSVLNRLSETKAVCASETAALMPCPTTPKISSLSSPPMSKPYSRPSRKFPPNSQTSPRLLILPRKTSLKPSPLEWIV